MANGRKEFLKQFPSIASAECQALLINPADEQTFLKCKLDFSERQGNRELYDLHIDLLNLRREDSRFRQQSSGGIDGAVLGSASFVLRFLSNENDDRLLLINLGARQVLRPASEPFLAPPSGCTWETLWTSNSPRYGGAGAVAIANEERWLLPDESAIALRPARGK